MYSTKYMRKRMSPPVSATDASAQIVASTARIRARTLPADATRIGTTTPTNTWSDPGPLPGGAPSVATRHFIGSWSAALNGTGFGLAGLLRVRLGRLRAVEDRPQAQGPERGEDRDRADRDVEGGHGDVLADAEGEQRRARGLAVEHVHQQALLRAGAAG